MIPQRLKSAASQCVLNTLCKKANSRKQMRAFLVKLAADRLQEAYKVSPSQSLLKKVNPVPGAKDRLELVRSSLAKKAVAPIPSPTAGPKLNTAPSAIKPPGPSGQPSMPKVPSLANPAPGIKPQANPYASSASMPKVPNPVTPAPSAGLNLANINLDTAYDLQNMNRSPATNYFDPENPVRQAMSAPDPSRLTPKPKMAPGMSNEINYGTGPSGNPVVADIVPGGTMPVARERGRTAAERDADKAKFDDFKRRNPAYNAQIELAKRQQQGQDIPPLTKLLGTMLPSERRKYTKWLQEDPTRWQTRNEIAQQQLDNTEAMKESMRSQGNFPSYPGFGPPPPKPAPAPAPELTPFPINEPEPESLSTTPLPQFSPPESVEVPPLSSVIPGLNPSPTSAQPTPAPAPQATPAPTPAPATARPQAKIPSPYPTNPLGLNRADVPTANFSQLNPQVLANSAGRQLGQAVNPNFLFNLFSNMGLAIPQGISNLFTNSGTPLGSRAALPSSYMQMVNDAVNDNSWQNYDYTRGKNPAKDNAAFEQVLQNAGISPDNFQL